MKKHKQSKLDFYSNYENCLSAAKNYKTWTEFHNSNRCAYDVAKKNGWLFDFFKKPKSPSNKLNFSYKEIKESALQCSSRTEFKEKFNSKYRFSLKNGLINDFKNLNPKNINPNNWVYCYYFKDFNVVYVGRTNNIIRRDKEHKNGKYIDKKNQEHRRRDAVYEFAKLHNIEVPLIQILEQNLSIIESQDKEDFYCKKFKDEGFILLNKAKTGVGVSSIGKLVKKYTYQNVYNLAKEYETINEFVKNHPSASTISYNNGWMKTFNWLKSKRRVYTLKECIDIANKFKTKSEFKINEPAVYAHMIRHKWLNKCSFTNGKIKNTKEKCFLIARQFETISDFRKNKESVYNKCKKMGWLKEMLFLSSKTKRKSKYNKNICMEVVKKYTNITDFYKNEPNLYSYIRRVGMLNKVKIILDNKTKHWTDNEVKEEALKYEYYNDFATHSRAAFNYAIRNNLINNFTWLKRKCIRHNIDDCIELSKKFKTLKEFRNNCPKELRAIEHSKRLNECTWLKKYKNQFG